MRSGLPSSREWGLLPGLFRAGNAQVRHRETGEAGFGLRAAARRAFIADLATRSGGGARERRNRRGVVVGLHLHEDVDGLVDRAVDIGLGIREVALAQRAFDDGRVVAIGAEHAFRILRVRVADHREQRLRLLLAVDDPVRVEDLVAAVLGVRLREHHELHVRGIALQRREVGHQVVDLVVREREAEIHVRFDQRIAAGGQRYLAQGTRGLVREQARGLAASQQHRLRHTVEQRRRERAQLVRGKLLRRGQGPHDATLDAQHRIQAADMRNVGRLARPGGNRAETRHHDELLSGRRTGIGVFARPVGQQPLQQRLFAGIESAGGVDEMNETRADGAKSGLRCFQRRAQLGDAEFGDCGCAGKLDHWRPRIVPEPGRRWRRAGDFSAEFLPVTTPRTARNGPGRRIRLDFEAGNRRRRCIGAAAYQSPPKLRPGFPAGNPERDFRERSRPRAAARPTRLTT